MKLSPYIFIVFFICFQTFGQFENKKMPINISPKLPPTAAVKPTENKKFSFEPLPKYTDKFPDVNKPRPNTNSGFVKEKFQNPNAGIVDKLNQKERDNVDGSKSDRFLGDFRSNGQFVRIICRDYGEVDGDRVRVYNNDKVVQYEIFLDGAFQEVNVTLLPGFNKIEFQALNMGTSGPNTAEFRMYDDKGKLVSANQWNLTTGVKATLIVVKE